MRIIIYTLIAILIAQFFALNHINKIEQKVSILNAKTKEDSIKISKMVPKNRVLGISEQITEALYIKESNGGKNCKRGASGEWGCFQYLKSTWESRSKKYLGKVVPQTKENERLVTLLHVDTRVKENYTIYEIALEHNQGNGKAPCRIGINNLKVPYNSCEYGNKIVAMVKSGDVVK